MDHPLKQIADGTGSPACMVVVVQGGGLHHAGRLWRTSALQAGYGTPPAMNQHGVLNPWAPCLATAKQRFPPGSYNVPHTPSGVPARMPSVMPAGASSDDDWSQSDEEQEV